LVSRKDRRTDAGKGIEHNVATRGEIAYRVCNQRIGSASPKQDGLIHLDLADEFCRCVEIGAKGWRIAEDPKLLRAVIDPNVATATSLPHKSTRPQTDSPVVTLRRCLCLASACAIIDRASPVRRNCNAYAMILTCSSLTPPLSPPC
jgi:hypothetical protein